MKNDHTNNNPTAPTGRIVRSAVALVAASLAVGACGQATESSQTDPTPRDAGPVSTIATDSGPTEPITVPGSRPDPAAGIVEIPSIDGASENVNATPETAASSRVDPVSPAPSTAGERPDTSGSIDQIDPDPSDVDPEPESASTPSTTLPVIPQIDTFEVVAVDGTLDASLDAFVYDGDQDSDVITIDWGDGTTEDLGVAGFIGGYTHTYEAPGLYTVTGTVVDSLGHGAHASELVAISQPLPGPASEFPGFDWNDCTSWTDGPDIAFFGVGSYSAYGTAQWVVNPTGAELQHAELRWVDGHGEQVDPSGGTTEHRFDPTTVHPTLGASLLVRDVDGHCSSKSNTFGSVVPVYDVTFHGIWLEATEGQACRDAAISVYTGIWGQAGVEDVTLSTGAEVADDWHDFGGVQRVKIQAPATRYLLDQRLGWTGPRTDAAAFPAVHHIGPVAIQSTLTVDGRSVQVVPDAIVTTPGSRVEWRGAVSTDGCDYELVVVTESRLHTLADL